MSAKGIACIKIYTDHAFVLCIKYIQDLNSGTSGYSTAVVPATFVHNCLRKILSANIMRHLPAYVNIIQYIRDFVNSKNDFL